ncbi:MAG: Holliday junction branch migration protein RuvA [Clostridiales bacterium]|jgi:Holliday junction DNA helicase RuvA|nr:Holliday junction branch migration protein RuvA [Bacillota bacterium]NLL54354.1 Holliday junction branch migration protein RuvA [Clostridiales bacterium]
MYAHIQGTVTDKGKDYLVLEAGGVGYLFSVSASTLSAAPPMGSVMKCYTWLSVREDALELFGFSSKEEKRMFERLRSVSGVGPKTALAILSALNLRDLSVALVTGDIQTLTRAPGIGKKTAQRLILELREKVEDSELTGGVAVSVPNKEGDPASEAIEVLMSLGCTATEAAQAVARAVGSASTTDEIIRLALKGMGS